MRKSTKILTLLFLGLWVFLSPLRANDYFSQMPPEIIQRVSADLYIQDLCNLELASSKFASVLQYAYQYKSFLRDYNPKNPIYSANPLTSRKIFLYYKEHSPEFRCHLGMLWEFYFPAISTLDFGLAYYWGNHLRSEDLQKIRKIYPLHPFEEDLQFLNIRKAHPYPSIDPKEEEQILASCPLALIRTLMTTRKRLSAATMRRREERLASPAYSTAREEYRAMLALQPKVDPATEVEVYWQLAEMDRLGEGINAPDWAAAKLGYLRILQSPGADLEKKMFALTTLAGMDYEGHGLYRPDYIAAQDKALTVLLIPDALPWAVADAKKLLAKLDQHKAGINNLEGVSVMDRKHYSWVINSSFALPEAKIAAQFKLAQMDYYGQGSQAPDYTAAQGYRGVIALPFIGRNLQKVMAYFYLAEMDYKGEGIKKPDYLSAQQGYTVMLNSSFDLPKEKIKAQFCLAEMYHNGRGFPKPDYAVACKMYETIINSSQATAEMREAARKALVLADISRNRKN